jgi:hypothetical protein
MISAETIRLLTGHQTAPLDYILGCRLRRSREVAEQVLSRAGRDREVADNLQVKQVRVGERRYVVCFNPIEAQKDAAARGALLDKLENTLAAHGPKAIIGNKGFARFVKVSKGSVSIDRQAVERDARLDGTFVLTTNTELPADEVALAYKSLWRVERAFRETKSTLEVRPVTQAPHPARQGGLPATGSHHRGGVRTDGHARSQSLLAARARPSESGMVSLVHHPQPAQALAGRLAPRAGHRIAGWPPAMAAGT